MFTRSGCAIAAFFLLSPFMNVTFLDEMRAFPLELLWVLAAYGFLSRFLGLYSYYQAIERLPVSRVSVLQTLTIVLSVAFASLYLGETLAWYHLAGCALIISGAMLMRVADLPFLKKKHLRHYVHINHRHIL